MVKIQQRQVILTRDFKNFVNEERMVFVDELKKNSVEFLDEFFSSVWCKSCSSTVFVRGDSQRKLASPLVNLTLSGLNLGHPSKMCQICFRIVNLLTSKDLKKQSNRQETMI